MGGSDGNSEDRNADKNVDSKTVCEVSGGNKDSIGN
jgi:hypothetical protein